MHYILSIESKITNSQKPEFVKKIFLHNQGSLNMCPKSIKKYLENYFGFKSEGVLNITKNNRMLKGKDIIGGHGFRCSFMICPISK